MNLSDDNSAKLNARDEGTDWLARLRFLLRVSPALCPTVRAKLSRMETNSKEQWHKIQTLARRTRNTADKHNQPGHHLNALYARSYFQARHLGYKGDGHEWRNLCRRIMGG